MKTAILTAGSFATGDGQKGNFHALTAAGDAYFIHKKTMAAAGFTKNEDLKFPLYATVGTKQINPRDEQGNIITDKFVERNQVFAVFKSQEEMVKAVNAEFALNVAITKDRSETAKAAGLPAETINSLLELA